MEHAAERGLVFATDPTSAWACTIGGNIAENAGGKDCVLYGTCIDNLVSWRMAMPSGRRWRSAAPITSSARSCRRTPVTFEVVDEDGAAREAASRSRGADIRKKGLWKDITNKALGGVPGLQKEGTDGVITSAEFILYPRVRGEADALPRVLRAGLRRGVARHPRARPRLPVPERRARRRSRRSSTSTTSTSAPSTTR